MTATRPTPHEPGDPRIKEQLVRIALARAAFRYPALDDEGNRAMRMETVVGWRDRFITPVMSRTPSGRRGTGDTR